jgi:hypothetical protein
VAGAVRAHREGQADYLKYLEECVYEFEGAGMRKARVPVCPRCTWPCDSRTAHGDALQFKV